jgi:ribosomal protein S27AE
MRAPQYRRVTERNSFTCPRCSIVSHNPNDACERYCGRCHLFFSAADVAEGARAAFRERSMPIGPNPSASRPAHVAPFANIFALVEGLGVISLHQTEAEAKTALEEWLERRRKLRVAVHDDEDKAPSGEDGGGGE